MPITADLTIREAAALAGVPRSTIEKALEAGVLRTVAGPARVRGGRRATCRSALWLFFTL